MLMLCVVVMMCSAAASHGTYSYTYKPTTKQNTIKSYQVISPHAYVAAYPIFYHPNTFYHYPYYLPLIRHHTPGVVVNTGGLNHISTISNNQPHTIIVKEFPQEVAAPSTGEGEDEEGLGGRVPLPDEPVPPAGIVQSTAPIFSTTLFHNSKQAPILHEL